MLSFSFRALFAPHPSRPAHTELSTNTYHSLKKGGGRQFRAYPCGVPIIRGTPSERQWARACKRPLYWPSSQNTLPGLEKTKVYLLKYFFNLAEQLTDSLSENTHTNGSLKGPTTTNVPFCLLSSQAENPHINYFPPTAANTHGMIPHARERFQLCIVRRLR